MTEKSARNPTPGSFPHTGSALAAPRPGSGGRRCGDSAEPPRRSAERDRGGARGDRGPPRSFPRPRSPGRGRRGAGGGGGLGVWGGRLGGAGARRLPSYDRSWKEDQGGARPAPRPADGAARARGRPSGARPRRRGRAVGELQAARPRAASSSAGEWRTLAPCPRLPPRPDGGVRVGGNPPGAVSARTGRGPRRRGAPRGAGRAAGGRAPGAAPAVGAEAPEAGAALAGRRGCLPGRGEADKAEGEMPGLFAEGLGPVPPRRGPGGRRARWVSPRRGPFGDLR